MKKLVISATLAMGLATPALANEDRAEMLSTYPPADNVKGAYQFSEIPATRPVARPPLLSPMTADAIEQGLLMKIKDGMEGLGTQMIICMSFNVSALKDHVANPRHNSLDRVNDMVCVDGVTGGVMTLSRK